MPQYELHIIERVDGVPIDSVLELDPNQPLITVKLEFFGAVSW